MKHPQIDPVALSLGPIDIHWYGLMYLLGFGAAWWLGRVRAQSTPGWDPRQIGDMIFYGAIGVVLGGRLGYILFYDLQSYLDAPLNALKLWEGGMSFHGGLIGVLVAIALFARRHEKRFFEVGDFVAPLIPIGLGAGRIGNFINGELWGRVSDLPWAMVFADPRAGGLARHPSQLYEAFLEGLVLFVILWLYSARPRPMMSVSGLFLLCYGVFRFAVEFTRMPDVHLGFIAGDWLTMGQLLSLPMIVAGAVLMFLALRHSATAPEQARPPKRNR
jgi:phosphatidylglycerol---prolipoprotein diacylglyceryl transferase